MQDYNAFLKIPKRLFTDEKFSALSIHAKLLYALLLDRKSLSKKNGWVDDNGKVYIYYAQKDATEALGMGRVKTINVFAELDGAGLIKRVRQGLGKPHIIYVYEADSDTSGSVNTDTSSGTETDISGGLNNKPQEVSESDTNNTNINNNNFNNTEMNNSILSHQEIKDRMDRIENRFIYKEKIYKNIDYKALISNYGEKSVSGIVNIMLDAVCSSREYIWIACEMLPQKTVSQRLLSLDSSHIEYVLECMKNNKTKVKNIKSYILTSLYNSPSTIEHYYTAEVNHDLSVKLH